MADAAARAGRSLLDAADWWAQRLPSSLAISAADGSLTFTELSERTRELAGVLSAEGVRRGTAVGLCLGRSRLSVPGLLAVWWLGATAVLMDERHPAERLSYVIRDAGAHLLVCDQLPADALTPDVRVLVPATAAACPPAPPRVRPHPEDCAYIVYTSGTTGRPKGVEVTYRGLGAFLAAVGQLGLSPGGGGVNAVSPAFDGWLWCACLHLLHGQRMAIVDLGAGGDPGERLAATSPTVVCLTPSLLAACETHLEMAEVIVIAGEPCPPGLVDQVSGDRRVLNVYGPTETTVAATWADSARGDDPRTIGRPLPGYTIRVLDDDGRPVAHGAPGELYVGGPGVARGYRGQPGLTAARFVPDPFAWTGARLYRTGDLVRYTADGLLEHLGRRDSQVKVRGFRVELAEVERAAGVPGVVAAAAFVTADGGALGLAVVIAGDADPRDCALRVRERCAARLPESMVPAAVEVVPTLPTFGTGKIDRAALAEIARASRRAPGRTPSTGHERLVCETWTELLGCAADDVDSDFFQIGGHSLLAARSVATLRRATGLPLSVRHLLAHPTPAGLARELDRLASEKAARTEAGS